MHFVLACLLAACAPSARLAPPPAGPLAIHVQYPVEGAPIGAGDSTFVFGRVDGGGTDLAVTVNGMPAAVADGGGWLAFVAVEPDTFVFSVQAASGSRTAEAERTVVVPRPLAAPPADTLPYKPASIEPRGPLELYAGDTLRVSVVAAPDLEVSARLGERRVALVPGAPAGVHLGRQVWGDEEPVEGATPPVLAAAARASQGSGPAGGDAWRRYSGDVYVRYGGADVDTLRLVFARPGEAERVVPLGPVALLDPTLVRVAVLDDDTAGTGRTDHRVIARTGPGLGYQLFLPNGTLAATGRRRGDWREIALGSGTSAWVPLGEAFPVAAAAPRSEIAVVRTRVADGWSEVILPLTERLPFRIVQRVEPAGYLIELYGLVSNVDWVETTLADPLIESVRLSQPANRVFQLDVELAGDAAWGWRAAWEGTHLVLGFRHPPPALGDRRFRSELHGVRIVVDPGHHPEPGSIGPTGLEERQVNLETALALAEILEARGAEVVLTRAPSDSGLGLYDRINLAVAAGGELFVSVHNNALPDGVNPFVHNGTSVLYYHPQSQRLAEAIQAELLPRTGLRDHGVWHQNLAVTRMNEMPAVLVESAFMMLPDQEADLRTPEYQRAIAEGIADGIERFLRESR